MKVIPVHQWEDNHMTHRSASTTRLSAVKALVLIPGSFGPRSAFGILSEVVLHFIDDTFGVMTAPMHRV